MENNSDSNRSMKKEIWCMPEQHYKSRERETLPAKNGYLHDRKLSLCHTTLKKLHKLKI